MRQGDVLDRDPNRASPLDAGRPHVTDFPGKPRPGKWRVQRRNVIHHQELRRIIAPGNRHSFCPRLAPTTLARWSGTARDRAGIPNEPMGPPSTRERTQSQSQEPGRPENSNPIAARDLTEEDKAQPRVRSARSNPTATRRPTRARQTHRPSHHREKTNPILEVPRQISRKARRQSQSHDRPPERPFSVPELISPTISSGICGRIIRVFGKFFREPSSPRASSVPCGRAGIFLDVRY